MRGALSSIAQRIFQIQPSSSTNAQSADDADTERVASASPTGAATASHEEPAGPRGARTLQFALERSLQGPPQLSEAAEAPDRKPELERGPDSRAAMRRFVKAALGLGLVVSLGWSPLRTMLTTTSVEALINARVETIRSPIEGIVETAPDASRDWRPGDSPPRLRVVDALADRARLDELKRQYGELETQSRALEQKSDLARAELQALTAQIERFRQGRLKLLDARREALTAEYEAAKAKSSEATAIKQRTEQLRQTGVSSAAELDRVRYDWVAATSAEAAAAQHLEETKVERDAVADGVFIGDSYNDSPSSDQRAGELRLRLGDFQAETEAARSQMKLVSAQIAEEEARYRQRSEALLVLPASGRVWEMLTGPGEHVGKGQELMRVLDCSEPMVSANVDESVYNRLEVGGRATFRPAQSGGKSYDGTIVNLTGAAGASANFAIPPGAMRKSAFYVTIALSGMNEGGCSVGRTGAVTFEARSGADASVSAPAAEDAPALRSGLF